MDKVKGPPYDRAGAAGLEGGRMRPEGRKVVEALLDFAHQSSK